MCRLVVVNNSVVAYWYDFVGNNSLKQIQRVIKISFLFKFISSIWSKHLKLMANLWATWATIVFFCLSMGYQLATFVCSLVVAHNQLLQIHRIVWPTFHLNKFQV